MKIAFTGQIARAPVLRALKSISGIELTEVDEVPDLVPLVDRMDALVINNPRGKDGVGLAAALSSAASKVKWIQVVSAGVDGLVPHGIPASIRLTNQGGAAAPAVAAVAEHAMALMMALTRRIDLICAQTAQANWDPASVRKSARALEASTIGIVGFGSIGQQVAARAKAFGMNVVGFSRAGEMRPGADRMHKLSELKALVPAIDVLMVCLALVPETNHLVDGALLDACKPGSLLVNVSRGEIVDSAALEAALRSGHLAGAAVDVTEPEPLPKSSSLWTAPNIIISPHIAAVGNPQVGARIAAVVKENIARFMDGRPLLNEVSS
jgi:phosphoglycerate dehydrogenase-like enzyme